MHRCTGLGVTVTNTNSKCWKWAILFPQQTKTRALPSLFSLETAFPGSSTRSSKPASQERSLGTRAEEYCSSDLSSSRGNSSTRRAQPSRLRTWAASCVSWTCTGFISYRRVERRARINIPKSRSSIDSRTISLFEVDSTYYTSYIATSESARESKASSVIRKKTHRFGGIVNNEDEWRWSWTSPIAKWIYIYF